MTEETLTAAREATQRNQGKKQRSSKALSILSLAGTFLLLIIWIVFLYSTGKEAFAHKINTYFEEAFLNEVSYHQFPHYMASKEKKVISAESTGNSSRAMAVYQPVIRGWALSHRDSAENSSCIPFPPFRKNSFRPNRRSLSPSAGNQGYYSIIPIACTPLPTEKHSLLFFFLFFT